MNLKRILSFVHESSLCSIKSFFLIFSLLHIQQSVKRKVILLYTPNQITGAYILVWGPMDSAAPLRRHGLLLRGRGGISYILSHTGRAGYFTLLLLRGEYCIWMVVYACVTPTHWLACMHCTWKILYLTLGPCSVIFQYRSFFILFFNNILLFHKIFPLLDIK